MLEILNLIADARRAVTDHDFAEAATRASSVLDRLPTCLSALRILAWAQLELESEAAGDTFQRCAAHDPEDALAYVGQAIWLQQRGQDDAARGMWLQAWELDPHNQAIRRALVKLTGELPESTFADAIGLLRSGREDEAADLLRRVRRERADAVSGLALLTALWASGSQREAFDVAGSVYATYPASARAALFVGAFEDRAGRTLRSREAIARAEQVDPGLTLFADTVRQVGLQQALDLHRASRTPLAAAR
jgi:thioredoxin-like negative regulator of GroEL